MDISPLDCNGQTTTNFDMEILTSMTNTDLLIRLIKDQAEETAALKSQLSSFNASAMQMKNFYTTEKKKNDHIETENRQLHLRIKALEAEISSLNNNLLNTKVLQEQRIAEMENQLVDKATVCRQVITQGNILKENHLSNRELHQFYSNAKEFLRKRGEDVEEVKVSNKKKKPAKVNASTMTEQLEQKEVKTFCDKSTMHCAMVSTATRGTTTAAFIQKVDVATNFPEPVAIEVEEIFRIMIDDMPPAITPIDELPSKTKYCQTEPTTLSNCSIGTITRIRNVRRKINYASDLFPSSPSPNPLDRVKKEKEDIMADLSNLDYPNQREDGSPINQRLTHLWQMVGQMIFSIIGNGEVFNHSTNTNLINDNLNQIRRVIERESEPHNRLYDMDELVVGSSNGFSNIATDISDSIAANRNNLNNSPITSKCSNTGNTSVTQNPPNVIQPTNRQKKKSPQKIQIPSTSPSVTTHKDSPNDVPFTTICQTASTSPCSSTHIDSSNNIPVTINSSVQCETGPIFKKPISGTKRKLATENCTIRKRNRTKMITSSVTSQPDKMEADKSSLNQNLACVPEDAIVSDERIKQSPPVIDDDDEPDAELVETILRYYKMPAFIEPITDPDFVVEADKRLSEVDVCNEIVDSKVISIELVSTDLSTDSISTIADSVSTDSVATNLEPACTLSIDRKSTDLVATEPSTFDEFDSPASPPPPFKDNALPYEPPLIIPTSPKKLNRSVVQDILTNFDKRKRLTVSLRKFKMPSATEEQILTSTRCRIENYVMSEWTANDIESCSNDLSNVRPSILSKCIIEVVMNTKSETLSREYTPPAPALPKTHQKIVVLIKRISRMVNRFKDLVLFQLEKEMFVLAGEKVSLAEGMNLTHLFIGLTDCMDGDGSRWSCVLFIYKCLYYFTKMAIPMIHSVLKAYPMLLPQFQDGDNVADLLMNATNNLQSTIAIILINTNLSELNPLDNGLKKNDLRIFLKKYYHFPSMSPTIDDFADSLVNRLANGCNLGNISYSLILIAKRKDTVWADDMVQRKLIPLLNHFLSTISGGAENDERIEILVSAISSIIKTFPITKDISNYQQMFYKMLDLTERHVIQEAAVMALLRTSRFGMVDVYKRICDWEPTRAVSRQCYSMLSTFLYRQNLSYWKQF